LSIVVFIALHFLIMALAQTSILSTDGQAIHSLPCASNNGFRKRIRIRVGVQIRVRVRDREEREGRERENLIHCIFLLQVIK
jgi:hypothetical protein